MSEIKITMQYKFVGIVVSTRTWNMFGKNQDHLAGKSRNAVYALKAYRKDAISQPQLYLSVKMFDAHIAPI